MFLDTRLGNTPQWFFERPKDWAMRVPERILKSVGFFARIDNKGPFEDLVYRGTGFFVGVPSAALPNRHYHFAVTASHVVDQLCLGDWTMRLNAKDGTMIRFNGRKDHKWWRHPTDPTVDIAVTPFPGDGAADFHDIPVSMFADKDLMDKEVIGAGDEVFTVGLFTKAPGSSQNLPIVRTGNVAMIPKPGEKIPHVQIGWDASAREIVVDAEAYLIEARSTGGLSGSPVFACLTDDVVLPPSPIMPGRPHPTVFHLHFPGKP